MSDGYKVKDVVLNGRAQSCSASATTPVTGTVGISSKDSQQIMAKVVPSAMAITNSIKFKLQESVDGVTWEDVGNQSEVSAVKKTFAGGVGEVTDYTWPATADAAQGDYVFVTGADGTSYAVWLDIDADGTEPSGAGYAAAFTKIKVSIVTGGSAADNAALARAAVVANTTWAATFTTSAVTTATFTVTQKNGGDVEDPAPLSEDDGGTGSITISVTTAGTDGGVNLDDDEVTSTSHGLTTGDPVLYMAGTVALGGLTTGTIYYAIVVDANTLQFATTQANARAGTAIDLTAAGTGTQAIFRGAYEIRMTVNDATDAAQMPLLPLVRVAAVTGVGDTCSVSHVYITRRV